MQKKSWMNGLLIFILPIIFFYLFLISWFNGNLTEPFEFLARSFLEGKADISKIRYYVDGVRWGGKIYWHLGPLPAILLVPFLWVRWLFGNLGIIYFLTNVLVFGAAYQLTRKITKLKKMEALWFAVLYVLGSVYIGIAFETVSWYFAQAVGSVFALLALDEYFGKKRYLRIGFLWALVLGVRIFNLLGLAFFMGRIIFSKEKGEKKIKNLILFLAPVFLALLILGWYNKIRFGNFLITGYGMAPMLEKRNIESSRVEGFFNLKNIPTNFYWYFLRGPEAVYEKREDFKIIFPYIFPNPWGMSLVWVMPFFFGVFFKKIKGGEEKTLLFTMLLYLFLLLCYYTTGMRQYSARLTLDFLPFWFALLLIQRQGSGLSEREKAFVLLSVFWNIYLASVFKWGFNPESRQLKCIEYPFICR